MKDKTTKEGIMGTKMLKIKQDLHYRNGYTSRSCSDCDHFIREMQITGIGGVSLGMQSRCKIIGTNPGRMYQINPKKICDRHDNTQYIARLKSYR